jgi:hypothetical protein
VRENLWGKNGMGSGIVGWFFAMATAMSTVQDKEVGEGGGEKGGIVFFYKLYSFLIYIIVVAK